MKPDDFETRLRRQPLRQMPGEWRQGILSAARQAVSAQPAPRSTPYVHVPHSFLSTLSSRLSTLLWPHPAAWAGLAAAWVVILGLNLATQNTTVRIARRGVSPPPQVFMAFQEQQRLLSELLGPGERQVADKPKPVLPLPRSDLRSRLLMA